MNRYIFVVGGVFSGLGKGVISASIAKLLQARGYKVNIVKIDPYINVDAGTMRPTEHGEVFVTYDGGETDQDLGIYERFLNIDLSKKNNITTGKVFYKVIKKEREGEYLGKTVQIFPHISNEIVEMIKETIPSEDYITIVEIGGTVGDYENVMYLVSAKHLELEGNNVVYVLVGYLPIPKHLGEMKTKPIQHAAKFLRETGIFPDIIIGRSEVPMDNVRKRKIAITTFVPEDSIFSAPDLDTIYKVPVLLEDEGLGRKLIELLNLQYKTPNFKDWNRRLNNLDNPEDEVTISLVGKYIKSGDFVLPDSYISVKETLIHAWAETGIKVNFNWVSSLDPEKVVPKIKDTNGIIILGGFGGSGVEGKIRAITFARENNIPLLGLCYGLQLSIVEIARNLLGWKDAHTTEVNPNTKYPVVDILPEQKELLDKSLFGGTMRLGEYLANIKEGTRVYKIYNKYGRFKEDKKYLEIFKNEPFRLGKDYREPFVFERHRHRYEINPKFLDKLSEIVTVSGYHIRYDNTILVEFAELDDHRFFIGTQAHPELKSRFEKPHPLFVELLLAAKK